MSDLPDGPVTDPVILARIEKGLAGLKPDGEIARILRAMRDHGSGYKEELARQRVEATLKVRVQVPMGPYRRWERQRQACGMNPAAARSFAPWFEDVWDEWLRRAQAKTEYFLFGYFPGSDCCRDAGRDDYVVHVADYQGHRFRLAFEPRGSVVELVTRDCGPVAAYVEWREGLDELLAARTREGPSPEALERVRAIFTSALQQKWDSAFVPERATPAAPSAEERRAKRLAKLEAEAEKMGFELKPKN